MKLSEFKQKLSEIYKTPEDYNETNSKRFNVNLRYMKLTFRLEHYQVPACYTVARFPNVLFTDEPGMGKTPTSIAAMSDIYSQGYKKFLVVALASILGQWEDSFKKFSTFDVIRIKGTREQRHKQYDKYFKGKADVLLVSYNTLYTDIEVFKRLHFDTMFCDECDFFKSPKSLTYNSILEMSRRIERVKLLTGTPFSGKVEDSFAAISVLAHEKPSVYVLMHKYCKFAKIEVPVYDKVTGRKRTVKTQIVDSYQNLDEFKELFNSFSYGRKAVDVGAKLPSVKEQFIYVDKTKEQIAFQKLTLSGVFVQADKQKIKLNSLQKISYLHRGFHSLNMLYEHKEYTNPKKEALLKLIDELGDEQVFIFCNYKHVAKELFDILQERGGCSRVDGDITGNSRLSSLEDFKSGANRYIVVTMAGYAGLDLFNCHNAIFYDYIYNRAKFGQIQGRILRKNSIYPESRFYYFMYRDSIDTAVWQLLERRKKQIDFFETSDEEVAKELLSDIEKIQGLSVNKL